MPNGFQDHWLAGSRFLFQRDDVNGVAQPVIDFGVIEPVNPDFQPEEVELKDSDGGVNTLIESSITDIEETYEVTCKNLSMQNFAFAFLAEPPSDFTRAVATKVVTHAAIKGHLVKIHDSDSDATKLYNVKVAGVTSDAVSGGVLSQVGVTSLTASTRTLVTASDVSADLSPGQSIILDGTNVTDQDNIGTYTIESVSTTNVVLSETVSSDEAFSSNGNLIYKASGDSGTVYSKGSTGDFEIVSNERGIIRCVDSGTIVTGNITVHFDLVALAGDRLIRPQAGSSDIKGEGMFFWARKNFSEQTVREARVSITPSSSNIQVTDYSELVFTIKVLSDVNVTNSAGRMLHFIGAVPDKS